MTDYFRKFIVLESFDSYTSKIKGYAKIEIRQGKGKIQINIDGIKDFDNDNNLLKSYLISDEGNERIYLGIVNNNNGKGSLEYLFNENSVGNSGNPLEKFNVIIIKSIGDEFNKINLGGYIFNKNDNISSLLNSINTNDIKVEEIKKEEIETIKREENKENETFSEKQEPNNIKDNTLNEEIDVNEENDESINDENNLDDIYNDSNNDFDDILKNLEDDIDYNKIENDFDNLEEPEEFNEVNQDNIEGIEDEYKIIEDSYNEYINNYFSKPSYQYKRKSRFENIKEYTMYVLKNFNKFNGIKRKLKNYEWWYIDNNNRYKQYLPYYHCTVNKYYPYPIMYTEMTCQKLVYKYGHFIFGIVTDNDDIKYFVYGVPGRFKKMEQPYSGKNGFSTWIECKTKGKYRMGYWLIHVDPYTGKIAKPLKTTHPK